VGFFKIVGILLLGNIIITLQACSTSSEIEKRIGKSLQEEKKKQTIHVNYSQSSNTDLMSKEISGNFNAYIQGKSVQSAGTDKIAVDAGVVSE
jgi:hypothetical protein